jgi:hypothetical protein
MSHHRRQAGVDCVSYSIWYCRAMGISTYLIHIQPFVKRKHTSFLGHPVHAIMSKLTLASHSILLYRCIITSRITPRPCCCQQHHGSTMTFLFIQVSRVDQQMVGISRSGRHRLRQNRKQNMSALYNHWERCDRILYKFI